MKTKIVYLLLLVVNIQVAAQDRKAQFRLFDEGKHQLLVSFEVPAQTENIYEYYYHSNDRFRNFIDENKLNLKEPFQWDEEHFNQLRNDALKYSETDHYVMILKGIYEIKNDLPNDVLLALAQKMEEYPFVRYAELNSLTPVPPPYIDIPPATPAYFAQQTYIQANPGVNMQYAWNQGVTGNGIRVRDVEYGMSVTHEELTASKFSNQLTINSAVDPSWVDHGTATAGVVAADNGGYGVTGMQHGISEFKVFPEYTNNGYNRLFAVSSAINQSVAGDVILYEMQTGGVNATQTVPNYVPAEYVNSIWDATKAATTAGIHIVAAAGNGDQNLDHSSYTSYINRGDSGALIIGAGSNTTVHSRLNFSTYGQRVDLQGWGMGVLTSGYGNFAKIGNDPNQSYVMFSGTSSATPIVASCVIALLSRAKASNYSLSPAEVKMILTTTGIAQGGDTSKPIGSLPNMMAALNYLDNYLLKNNKVDAIPMNVFPNPVNNELFATFPDEFENNTITIYDMVGREVYQMKNYKSNTAINVSTFKNGMYVLKMKSNNAEQSKKIVVK